MTIRPVAPTDLASLAELAATTIRETFGPPHNPENLVDEYITSACSEAQLRKELADRRAMFFVAEGSDRQLIGFAKLRRHAPPRRMTERNAIELQRLYLRQSQVGQGNGKRLMNHCLNWAQAQGYAAIWLGVWEHNTRALTFYDNMGFTRFGYHHFWFGSDRQRDYWLQKPLSAGDNGVQ